MTPRYQHLQRSAYRIAKALPLGKPDSRRVYRSTLKAIVRDLATLHCLPAEWSGLMSMHIKALVAYWHTQKVSDNRIADRLSTLRHFARHLIHPIILPKNGELGIVKQTRRPRYPMIELEKQLANINSPLVCHLVAMQIYFGCTKREAIISTPIMTIPDFLLMTRDTTHNSQDRMVPITLKQQVALLHERTNLLQGKPHLLTLMSYRDWCVFYKIHLQLAGLSHQTPYRIDYARRRYRQLNFSAHTKCIIAEEMGVSTAWVERCCDEQTRE